MVKAKVIEDSTYFDIKHKLHWYILLPSIPFALLLHFTRLSNLQIVLALAVYLIAYIMVIRYYKRLRNLTSKRTIELTTNQLVIKSNNGASETYAISALEHIKISYGPAPEFHENPKLLDKLKGVTNENFISFERDGQESCFYFEIESYYYLKQLEKIHQHWSTIDQKVTILNKASKA